MKRILSITGLALIISLATILTSCKKDEEDPAHEHAVTATIQIFDPVADSAYENGQSVDITVEIEGSAELHGYQILMINTTSGDTVKNVELHDHAMVYSYGGNWINDVTEHSEMVCKVKAILDHDGNSSEKSVDFHCHPM